jgi:hypothetical protein
MYVVLVSFSTSNPSVISLLLFQIFKSCHHLYTLDPCHFLISWLVISLLLHDAYQDEDQILSNLGTLLKWNSTQFEFYSTLSLFRGRSSGCGILYSYPFKLLLLVQILLIYCNTYFIIHNRMFSTARILPWVFIWFSFD